MTVGQKASVSLLIAVLLFAAMVVAAFSGLFDLIESKFYNPAVTRGFETSLAAIAEASDRYHGGNLERFRAVLTLDAVKRSFLPNMSAQDAFDRANSLGKLQEVTVGLVGIRIVESNGRRIHFSSFPGDLLRKGELETVYRNYGESGDRPYVDIAPPETSTGTIAIDPSTGRFLYALPFIDGFGVYRGSAFFTVAVDGLLSILIKEGLATVGEPAFPAADKGLLLKVPSAARELLSAKVGELWAARLDDKPLTIATSGTEGSGGESAGEDYVLFSKPTALAGYIGFVTTASSFALPAPMKWLLLISFFVTSYLLAFLLLNVRQDRMVVLKDRVKRLQINLLEEYIDKKADMDFDRWNRELASRKAEVRAEIRRGVGTVRKRKAGEVDELIDKSWDEILTVIGGKAAEEKGVVGLKEIERLLGEALKSGRFVLSADSVVQGPKPAEAVPVQRTAPAPKKARPVTREPAPSPLEVEKVPSAPKTAQKATGAKKKKVQASQTAEGQTPAAIEKVAQPPRQKSAEKTAIVEVIKAAGAAAPAVTEAAPALEAALTGGAAATEAVPQVRAVEEAPAVPAPASEELSEGPVMIEEIPTQPFLELPSISEQAFKLAEADGESALLIPEFSGLELAEDMDISEIIGFIDVEESSGAGAARALWEAGSTGRGLPQAGAGAGAAEPALIAPFEEKGAAESPELILDGFEAAQAEEPEVEPEELELDIQLSSIDLSSLAEWGLGAEAGAELEVEAPAPPSAAVGAELAMEEAAPSAEESLHIYRSEEQSAAPEADDSAIKDGEIPMLTDEMRELLEYLPTVEPDDSAPVDVVEYLGPVVSYTPVSRMSQDSIPAVEELPVVEDGEAWVEAEYLGEIEKGGAKGEEESLEEPAYLPEGSSEEGPVVCVEGVFQINPRFPDKTFPIDRDFQELVDSVLGPGSSA
jgi:hypothetical protein